ncbi:hypothetical protein [Chryseobacterium flavum]|uniref:hypothetical protein n=1 Tax=Chryseobacterium flavum TaxID=415851 RepID=UPI0028AFA1D1|nr:hypothetical protein [Chryseobacterium flavum]
MKNSIKTIISRLYKNTISKDSFIEKYEQEEEINIDELYIKNLIKKGIENKSASDIEEAIVLIYSGNFDNHEYIEELCKILLESWHFKHEDIVRILHDLRDPSTVDCLYKVAEMHFDYLDYDDTYQLARKSIKALSAIDSHEAINKLHLLSNSKISLISDYAKKEIKSKGL